MKKISVITINYNQPVVTEELLYSIALSSSYPNLEIIVVDNGSTPNPLEEWIDKFPNVRFIRSEVNLGFAAGNNLGIQAAFGDYYFLVNNDTEFTPNLIEKLIKILETNPRVGIVSPKIRYFNQPDILQYVGFTPINFYTARNKCIGQYERDQGQYDTLTGPTGFVHGAAMMVRKEAVQEAGLMEENYFLYYEEMDWCVKIKQAGYDVWVEPKALIFHKESISVGKKSALKEYFINRNRILFIRKNGSFLSKLVFYFYFLTFVTPRNIVWHLKESRTDLIPQLLKAIAWNITHKKNSSILGFPLT